MTIRESIQKRLIRAFCVALLAFISLFIFIFYIFEDHTHWIEFLVFPFIIIVGAAYFLNFGLRCPSCGGNLGITIGPVMFTRLSKRPINYCPFCGISLDTRIDDLQQPDKP